MSIKMDESPCGSPSLVPSGQTGGASLGSFQHEHTGESSCGSPYVEYSTLKRPRLQQLCKKYGLRAIGKNADLVKRLSAFHRGNELQEEPSTAETTPELGMVLRSGRVVQLAHRGLEETSAMGESSSPYVDYTALKRRALQQRCKKYGLRANGKNTDLVERLLAFHRDRELQERTSTAETTPETPLTVPPLDLDQDVRIEPSSGVAHGWCVVHGMVLHHPVSPWAPLLLSGGSVYVPFHLAPLTIPVPDGFSNNYICESCVLRNRKKPKGCPTGLKTKRKRTTLSQDQTFLQGRMSQSSFLKGADISRDRRTFEIKRLYQPQEDQTYALRVDGILSQMASGELGMDRVFFPLHALVVHSPAPFKR